MDGLSDDLLLEELRTRFTKNKEDLEILQRITNELRAVNLKLAESEEHKSHFISHITNEINNPFTSILGLSKNIMLMPSGSENKMRHMAKLIFDEAYVLDFQLKNIFAAAQIEAGNLAPHFSRTEIMGMMNRVVSSMIHVAQQQRVEVEIISNLTLDSKGQFFISVDAEKLEIILVNLCNNAIRFGQPGLPIVISLSHDQNQVTFSFQNFGKLLTEEEQQEMFDRFKRLEENINSINPGQGLGLSVAKAFSQILDGEISVESTPENGNVFNLSIPSRAPREHENTTEADGYELFTEEEELF